MKIIIVIIIFITGLIMIHQKQKISDLEDELQYLARLLYDNTPKSSVYSCKLVEDEHGTITLGDGKVYRIEKVQVDKEEKM